MPARQVGGVAQPAGVGVEGAGGADDEPVDVVPGEPGRLHRPVEGIRHLPYDGLGGPPARSGELELSHRPSGDVGDGGADALRRDVEPGGVRGTRIDHVQLGVGARPPLAGPGGEYEPRGLQPGQQLRGGRLGEAGELADPGAGERAVLQEEVEGGTVVHGAQDAGGARGAAARGTGGSCHVLRHLPFELPNHIACHVITVRKVSNWVGGT